MDKFARRTFPPICIKKKQKESLKMADITDPMKCPNCNEWYDVNHANICGKNNLCDQIIAKHKKLSENNFGKEINMWILTDEFGRIYYQGSSEESVNDYKESNGFKERFVVKLTGYLPGEK